MKLANWKAALFKRQPRYHKCCWCEKNINLNGFEYVCDGAGETLHYDCFNERWGIIRNENRKKHSDS